MNIVDKATNEIIGNVVTNQSLTFEQAMELAGFEYIENINESGWTKDGGKTFYDENTVIINYE